MTESSTSSQETTPAEPTAAALPAKAKRTFWQWVWTIVVVLIGAFIGLIASAIVGLATGLIEISC